MIFIIINYFYFNHVILKNCNNLILIFLKFSKFFYKIIL